MYKPKKRMRMKTLYKSIFVIGLGIISLATTAQTAKKDSTLTRQVLLERDYNPTLQEASKINTMPSIYTPTVKAKDLNYVSSAPQLKLGNSQLGSAESGDIQTSVDFNKKRGYFNIGAGSHKNIEGAAGYRILNSSTDRLDFSATHSSTNGEVDYIDGGKYIMDDVKAKFAATNVKLKYQHIFEPSILSLDGSFYNTSYNYYGNSFMPKDAGVFPFDISSRQNVDVINIGAGIKASNNNEGLLKYMGNLRYRNFKSKYGLYNPEKGAKGGQIDLDVNFYTDFGSDKSIGIRGSVMNQSFSGKDKDKYIKDAYHSFTNITATPYIKFEGSNWNADLGVNVSGLFDVKTKMYITPNVKAAIHINEVNTFYGEVTGGVNNNTFLDILQENRYVDPIARIQYSKTLFDAKIGFKSGVVSGFEFDVFAGYKKTDQDHLYIAKCYNPLPNPSYPEDNLYWPNVSKALYADIGTGHIGGILKTNLIPYTDLSLKATAYFYNVKDAQFLEAILFKEYKRFGEGDTDTEAGLVIGYLSFNDFDYSKKAWGRPTFTFELKADIKPIDQLTFTLNYLYAGGRKAMGTERVETIGIGGGPTTKLDYTSANMKDINELNIRAEYQILDWVSVHASANNLLFQKYELQYGYPLQGFNFLGGLNFKF